MDWSEIQTKLVVAVVPAAASFLLPPVRAFVRRCWDAFLFLFRGPGMIFRELQEMNVKMDAVKMKADAVEVKQTATDLKVDAIKHQVEVNGGGSLKDSMLRLESYRRIDFWKMQRPALELNGQGHVLLASEAACRLFHVSDPKELYRISWKRFLDGNEVMEFMKSFRETAAEGSLFRFAIGITDSNGAPRGKWEFKARPVDITGAGLYSGFFTAVDEVAKELAGRCGWLG